MASDPLASAQHYIFVTQVYFCCMCKSSPPPFQSAYVPPSKELQSDRPLLPSSAPDAVVVWDWVVSLPREYKFSSWTAAKLSYLFCRYWVLLVMPYILSVFVGNHSLETCQRIYRSPVALAMWNQAGAEGASHFLFRIPYLVLLIRTYAFFNRDKYLLAALTMGLAGVLAYQLYVDIEQMLPLPFVTPPFDKGPCFPMSKPHSAHILGFFVRTNIFRTASSPRTEPNPLPPQMASLAFDATVTMMTLWKAISIRRMCGPTKSPLIQTFLREGIFYFVSISIANLVNGIFYLQPKAVMSAINIPLSVMFADVLACRMILDLRERGYSISQPSSFSQSLGYAHAHAHGPTRGAHQHAHAHALRLGLPGHAGTTVSVSGASDGSVSALSDPAASPHAKTKTPGVVVAALGFGGGASVGSGVSVGALTTTIDSTIFSQTRTGGGGGADVELRSFASRDEDEDGDGDGDEDKGEGGGRGRGFGRGPYQVMDVAGANRTRADVEKASV
ncbi:hypothetical protein M0805_004140 [Coniferiporia weirii]|nr:hypothetical protein M0805_004140 [Coniferiporia weirii]